MDINELESFKLSDAVKFHEELNPKLWEDHKLDPEVRDQLLLIAEDFVEYLGISNLKVKDVTISGSNAAYSYTPHSDLDLHILVDFSELPNNEVYQELFTAKKTLYNDQHDISVHDVPVELYVQDTNQPVQSLGEYSIVHDKWIRIPKKRKANFDEAATKAKYEKLGDLIELALKSKDPKKVDDTISTVKRYRQAGLDKHGEFGPENLAYKAVRSQGLVTALYDLKSKLHAEKLSIEEAASRDDALIKIKKLLQTAGRTPAEKDNIKRIVAKIMQQWNIDPSEIGVRQPVDPLKAKIAKAQYEKQMAYDAMKDAWKSFKNGIFAEDEKLDKPEMTVDQLAKKHKVSVDEIKAQLAKGIKVELEHTSKRDVAREIALDHLAEDPKYYDKLAKVDLEEAFDSDEFRRHMAQLRAKEELKKTNPIAALAQDLANKEHERLGTKPKKDSPSAAGDTSYDPFTVPGVDNPYDPDPYKGHLDEEQLDETAQESQLINLISKRAAEEIFKMLRKKESTLAKVIAPDMKRSNLQIWGISAEKLGVPYINDPVLGSVLQHTKFRAAPYLDPINRRRIASYDPMTHDITVHYPAIVRDAKDFGYETQEFLAKVIAHELQHAVDNFKSRGKTFNTNKKEYSTLPYEINARFQEALMNITMAFDQARKQGKTLDRKHLPAFIDASFNHNHISQFLPKDGKRYKRLAARAYKFFDAELNNPKKEQPLSIVKRAINYILEKPTSSVNEASGYIPSEKEKNDPRFKTALTVDVKPDAIKKNAKAFGWTTSRAGIPPQARADGKIAEDLMKEWKSFLAEDQEQQELFPGYDKEHREKRLDNWLQHTHAWDGHKPRMFYHATTKDFDSFQTSGMGVTSVLGMTFDVERHGSFFAVDPKFAETFIEDPNTREYKPGGRIIPVYLSVQNPIDLRDNNLSMMLGNEETVEGFKQNDIDLRSIYNYIDQFQRWELFDGPEGAEFVQNLKKLGFDGAIIAEAIPNDSNAKSGEVWVVFNPNQVKAIHNRGSFSPDDPRMMKENG